MKDVAVISALREALGSDVVVTGPALAELRMADWSGAPGETPLALLKPRSTAEVAQAVSICDAHGQNIVTQGGLTGLAGGACCTAHDVALRLDRMNRIVELDPISSTITVEAGVTLQQVQEAADAVGLFFPLDLGARGSCTIGGNLATNAGGNRVVRYGTTRDQVLGVEAVLGDGRVVSGLHKMVKNNTGYDLRHLMIGSEGTLGVITRAVLKLQPRPGAVATAWCGLGSFEAVTTLLSRGRAELPGGVSAFEVMWPSYLEFMLGRVPRLRMPTPRQHALYVLLESSGTDAEHHDEIFESFLARQMEAGVIEDAAIARSQAATQDFWAIRDATAEFPILLPGYLGFDVSFAIGDVGPAATECEAMLRHRWPDCTAVVYGHLGDGNLHVVAHVDDGSPETGHAIEDAVYGLVARYGGAVSAEHGIGTVKRKVLDKTRSSDELAAMAAIKSALDPRHILNRGKVL